MIGIEAFNAVTIGRAKSVRKTALLESMFNVIALIVRPVVARTNGLYSRVGVVFT